MAAKFVCIFSLLIAATSTHASGFQDGNPTKITSHPYYVSIKEADGTDICGGALISPNIVVTAASCIVYYEMSELVVRVGSRKVISVAASTFDEAYDYISNENDVGLLKLAEPIEESSSVGVIKIASSQPATGASGEVIGLDRKQKLVEIPVSIINSTDCASGEYIYSEDGIFASQMCALPKLSNACDGEPGSPLVSNNKLIGLVSWGNDCYNKGNPAVYTNVVTLKSWIKSTSKSL